MVPSENRKNVTDLYLKTTAGALWQLFPTFDWMTYLNIIIGREVDPEEPVACYCMDYLYKLFEILNKTPSRYCAFIYY